MAKTGYDGTQGFEDQVRSVEAELAGLMGVVNASQGRLVELVADGIDGDLWNGWGIHSPAHWVAWKTGMTQGRAKGIVTLAGRRAELPMTFAALVAGELAVDAAVEIGRHAPAAYEESICQFAKLATMSQLQRCLRRYVYDPATEKNRAKPVTDERHVSTGTDDLGWWIKGRLPANEGAVVDQALGAAQQDLYNQNKADTPEGERPESVSTADAMVGLAESFLRQGQAAKPGSDRFQVLLHLEALANRADGVGALSFDGGPRMPDSVRRLLLCGCTVAPVWERHGSPVSVGRAQRVLSRRMRRLIEHRDGECRIPGCGRRRGLEVHHIVHWEDGGATDTGNLVSLCGRHHQLHHQGLLGIEGDADPIGELIVSDRWGHALDAAGTPVRPAPGVTPAEAAEAVGIVPGAYTHPLGERLDSRFLTFHRNPGIDLDLDVDLDVSNNNGEATGAGGSPPPPIPLRPPGPNPCTAGPDGRAAPASPCETEPGAPWPGAAPPAA